MVSKRFHLTIYRVLHEESESELKNDQILQPYAVFLFFRTLNFLKISFLEPRRMFLKRFELLLYSPGAPGFWADSGRFGTGLGRFWAGFRRIWVGFRAQN